MSDAEPRSALLNAAMVVGATALLLATLLANIDYRCLPEFPEIDGGLRSWRGFYQTLLFVPQRPLLFVPALITIAALGALVAVLPFRLPEHSTARTIGALGPMILLAVGTGWTVLSTNGLPCDDSGLRSPAILMQIVIGCVFWLVGLIVLSRAVPPPTK
ncbi:MAG: hypothetical protein AB8B60_06090 [Sulfitobacter sp.]